MSPDIALPLILIFSVGSLFVAGYLASWVLKRDQGTTAMQAISNAIKEGAEAFLRRQNRTIGMLAVLLAVVIFVLYAFVRGHHDFDPVPTAMLLAVWTTLSFVLGAACSVIAGYIGMWVSIRTNIRTASAARTSLNDALRTALRGGAVSGLFVVAMSLFGVGGLYWLVRHFTEVPPAQIPLLIVGYGFGASFVALFAQLGGGIYTKAADVGADLVGKVEAGIPEDDPRNPAVIADLVGDNVGDCAGRGADLFESTAAENIGAMILGATLAATLEKQGMAFSAGIVGVMLFPLVARAFGLLASIVGIFAVRTREDADPMAALNRGYYITSALAIAGFFVATKWLLQNESHPNAWWMYFICGMIGVLTSIVFVFITQYYTEYKYRPVQEIAEASQTGPATNVIAGIADRLRVHAHAGRRDLDRDPGFLPDRQAGAARRRAVRHRRRDDGHARHGRLHPRDGHVRPDHRQRRRHRRDVAAARGDPASKTDRLDAVGNTTKALTKGYAIGSAALAAFLLFSAYLDEVKNYGAELTSVNLAKPEVFVGGLLGAMLVFFFSGLAIKAVGKAAYVVIQDVRAQFQEHPGIMLGTEKPDYGRTVDIVTRGALRQMIAPGLVAVGMPIAVGLIFKQFGVGAEAVAALLMVGTIAGILMATFLNNAGGAWDNAKKYIETGAYGGKGSPTHKAAVVGDTVGDPFKDTAGPSLHVLIKLLATITLVLAPLFI